LPLRREVLRKTLLRHRSNEALAHRLLAMRGDLFAVGGADEEAPLKRIFQLVAPENTRPAVADFRRRGHYRRCPPSLHGQKT
jgi:hypothetical protein